MARNGTARHGTVRHGTVRNDTKRYGTSRTARYTARDGKERNDPVWHDTIRHCTGRHGTTERCDTARYTTRHGKQRYGTARHGMDGTTRHCPLQYGPVRRGMARHGAVRSWTYIIDDNLNRAVSSGGFCASRPDLGGREHQPIAIQTACRYTVHVQNSVTACVIAVRCGLARPCMAPCDPFNPYRHEGPSGLPAVVAMWASESSMARTRLRDRSPCNFEWRAVVRIRSYTPLLAPRLASRRRRCRRRRRRSLVLVSHPTRRLGERRVPSDPDPCLSESGSVWPSIPPVTSRQTTLR